MTEYLPERRGFSSVYGFLGGFVDPYTHYAEAPPICESDMKDCVTDWSSPSTTYAADAVAHEAKRVISSTSEKAALPVLRAADAARAPLRASQLLSI